MRFAAFLSRLARNLKGAKRLARHCRLDRQSYMLRPSHKPQGGHADADGDGQDGTQGQETVVEGGTGGEDVI